MKNFNVAQVISVLANVAVFGGLVFLGYETRQNTVQLRAAASYSLTQGLSNLNSGVCNDGGLADLMVRGEQDLSSLTPAELARFGAFQFDRINLAIHVQILEDEGVSDVQFPYVEFLVRDFHSKPGLQEFLLSVRDTWVGAPELYQALLLDDAN